VESPQGTASRDEEELAAAAREHPWGPPAENGERLHALGAISEEFPGWLAWPGVATLLYARRHRTSPPMVVRAATPDGLRQAIQQAERERGLR
jgi:hypothetical protein